MLRRNPSCFDKMWIMTLKVTNFTDDKFPQLVEFYESLRRGGAGLSEREVRFLRTKFARPLYNPVKNLFFIEADQKINALLDIVAEPRIHRIIFNCLVQPGFSYVHLSRALLEKGMARCRELDGERIHICLRENDYTGHEFFLSEGYSRVRTYLDLEADLMSRNDPNIKSGRFQGTSFSKGEEYRLKTLQNDIFVGSWGFCPNTVDEIKYYLALTETELEDVILLEEEGDVVGYCWVHESLSSSNTSKIARIHMIGIQRKFQGRGLGRELLRLSNHILRKRGYRKVELTVDSNNKPACGLYTAFGFQLKSRSFWFEKSL